MIPYQILTTVVNEGPGDKHFLERVLKQYDVTAAQYSLAIRNAIKNALINQNNPKFAQLELVSMEEVNFDDGRQLLISGPSAYITISELEYKHIIPQLKKEIDYETRLDKWIDFTAIMFKEDKETSEVMKLLLEEYHQLVEEGAKEYKTSLFVRWKYLRELGEFLGLCCGSKEGERQEALYADNIEKILAGETQNGFIRRRL